MLFAYHTLIYDVEFKNGKVTMVLSDLSKAFDRCNRNIIIYKVNNINITGNNLRLSLDELNNSKA